MIKADIAAKAPALLFDHLIDRGLSFTANEFRYLRRRIIRLTEDDIVIFRNTRRVRKLLSRPVLGPIRCEVCK